MIGKTWVLTSNFNPILFIDTGGQLEMWTDLFMEDVLKFVNSGWVNCV